MNHKGHEGHKEQRTKRAGWLVFLVALTALGAAQAKPEAELEEASVEVVPIDKEPSHHLVFENEYVRVFSVEVAPHAETKYHQHDRDYVWVSLGDSDVESVRVGAAAVALQPKDGDAQFAKGGFAHKAVNKGGKPFRNVTVELKKGAGIVTVCAQAMADCVYPLTYASKSIGSRQVLFSSGTTRAERFRLFSNDASFARSYTSVQGESKVLLIPITPVRAGVDATTRDLNPGEAVWAAGSPEVTVRGKGEWVVLQFWGARRK